MIQYRKSNLNHFEVVWVMWQCCRTFTYTYIFLWCFTYYIFHLSHCGNNLIFILQLNRHCNSWKLILTLPRAPCIKQWKFCHNDDNFTSRGSVPQCCNVLCRVFECIQFTFIFHFTMFLLQNFIIIMNETWL